jgi:1,4-alpha-glucan branching enzyme
MISGVYYPKINGAVVAVSNMVNSLSARGHQVNLVTRRERGSPRVENLNGVRIVRVGNPGFKLSSRIALSFEQFYAALKVARADAPDVIHAHGFTSLLAGAALGVSIGRPVVVSFHGIQRLWSEQARWRNPLTFDFMLPIERALLRMTTVILAQSNLLKRVITQVYEVRYEKIVVLPNPIDTQRFEYATPAARDSPVVLFVGSLMKVHGPDILVEALPHVLQRFPKAKLVIVGKGPLKNLLSKRIGELGLSDSVSLLDEVGDQRRLSEIYHTSRLVVIPLRYTGYILSLVGEEAMACGRPVVTTMTLDEELSKVGVVKSGTTPEELAEAISSVLSWGDNDYGRVSQTARRFAEETFSFEAVGSSLESIYKQAVYGSQRIDGGYDGGAKLFTDAHLP